MRTPIVSGAVLLFFAYLSEAATIHIPADQPTIQAGIDAAFDGDLLLVEPGIYAERIDFAGKAITVRSRAGAKEACLDGGGAGPVVSFRSGEGEDSVLDGFTITNGASEQGGGIFCAYASPRIMNNLIRGNRALKEGGGVYCVASAANFANNLMERNSASYGAGVFCDCSVFTNNTIRQNKASLGGGGICCGWQSWAEIKNNVIIENTADGDGGGILFFPHAVIWVDGNTISKNSAVRGGGIHCEAGSYNNFIIRNVIIKNTALDGGGISLLDYWIDIDLNIISQNTASRNGGGLFCLECNPELYLAKNTVVSNRAGEKGGGLYSANSCTQVHGSIFWDNTAPQGPEVWLSGPEPFVISYSDVKGGQNGVFVEAGGILDWGPGMIDADPRFVDPGQADYHLTFDSPCRDTGLACWPFVDFEGDSLKITVPDMGADEFYTHLYCTGSFKPGGFIEIKFVGYPGTRPVALFFADQVLGHPVFTPYGEWHLKPPWVMVESLNPIPFCGLLTIPVVLPQAWEAPLDLPMQALIGMSSDSLSNLFLLQLR